ncbi:MAG: hypothetical protein V3V95_09220, partial [Thermodesulfobacteriota bacterium]
GKGLIDLKTEKLDFVINPAPKKLLGKLTSSLGELSKPFKLSGTLANPKLGISTTRTVLAIGKLLGSTAVLGPAGLATGLVSPSSGKKNLCLSALEEQKKSQEEPVAPLEQKKGKEESTTPASQSIEDIGGEVLKLFGK